MALMALYALIIFVAFAVVGGLAVAYIVRNQPEDSDLPPRGMPQDDVKR